MEIKKNEIYEVEIIDNGCNGEGIAKIDGFTVFVPNVIKGEKVEIKILKVLSSHAFAKVEKINSISEFRKEADCDTFSKCGGCSMRHMEYVKTLEIKRNVVESSLRKQGISVNVNPVIGMVNPYFYRNKLQYPVGINEQGEPVIGVFAQRSHRIIETKKCMIQNRLLQNIANDIFEFIKNNDISVYDEKNQRGQIRHLVLRIGVKTNEVMVTIVSNEEKIDKENELVKYISEKYSEIKTIVKNINTQNTNVVMGKENIVIYGSGYIKDQLGKYIFKISPHSFYQVNPIQAENLYNIGVQAANISKNDIVFDLYCGIGTISLFMAQYAKKVYGIEIVEQAIQDAKENAKINNIENAEFIAGDVENVLDDLIKIKKVIPDVIMIDPPRKGMDNKSVENILNIKPKKLVYISCNPATLVRDLAKFEEEYEVKTIKPVDMFPFTSHVVCVSVL